MARHASSVGITSKRQIASVMRKNPGLRDVQKQLNVLSRSVAAVTDVLQRDVARLNAAFLKLYDAAEARSKKR